MRRVFGNKWRGFIQIYVRAPYFTIINERLSSQNEEKPYIVIFS